jgi:hypothetical protein
MLLPFVKGGRESRVRVPSPRFVFLALGSQVSATLGSWIEGCYAQVRCTEKSLSSVLRPSIGIQNNKECFDLNLSILSTMGEEEVKIGSKDREGPRYGFKVLGNR